MRFSLANSAYLNNGKEIHNFADFLKSGSSKELYSSIFISIDSSLRKAIEKYEIVHNLNNDKAQIIWDDYL